VLEIGQTVNVKVLDIDRERQRISLGLKQTQADPWQQVLEAYKEGDVVDGKVTKVVTFGAFVEILPGVEGLVHISELAQHHVENPREVVSQGQDVKVLILEVDADRRRLSLSMKRVDGGDIDDADEGSQLTPNLGLSEEVFAEGAAAAVSTETEEPAAEAEEPAAEAEAVEEVEAAVEAQPEAVVEEVEAAVETQTEAAVEEPVAVVEDPPEAAVEDPPEAAVEDPPEADEPEPSS
jgi:small subunit ribosomal protein S1